MLAESDSDPEMPPLIAESDSDPEMPPLIDLSSSSSESSDDGDASQHPEQPSLAASSLLVSTARQAARRSLQAWLDEVNSTRKLKGLKRKTRKAKTGEQRGEATKALKFDDDRCMLGWQTAENPKFVDKRAAAMYTSAGDKYRLTLINISYVKNWWKPGATP